MKKLVIALMALSLVLVAVSFVLAEGTATTTSGVVAFQTTIPPGGVDASIYASHHHTVGGLDVDTSNQLPIQVGVAAGTTTATTTGVSDPNNAASGSYSAGGSQEQAATYRQGRSINTTSGFSANSGMSYRTYQGQSFGTHGSAAAGAGAN